MRHKSKLLNRKVMMDVYMHNLAPSTLESLRRAIEEGFMPSDLNLGENDGSITVLRLTHPLKSRLLNRFVADEENIRHVALELVRLGREVPEASWFEDAEDYAVAMVRRLVEVARGEVRDGAEPPSAGLCPASNLQRRTGLEPVPKRRTSMATAKHLDNAGDSAKQQWKIASSIHTVGEEAISLLKALGRLSTDRKRKIDAVAKASEIIAQRNEEVRPLLAKVRDHIAKGGEANGCKTWEGWARHAGYSVRNLNYIVNGRKSRKDGNPGSREQRAVRLHKGTILSLKGMPNSRKLATTEFEVMRQSKDSLNLKCVEPKQNIWTIEIRVRPIKAEVEHAEPKPARKLRKFEPCSECGQKMSVMPDGTFGKHVISAERAAPYCKMSGQPVVKAKAVAA